MRYELQITTDNGRVSASIIDTENQGRIVEDCARGTWSIAQFSKLRQFDMCVEMLNDWNCKS